MAATMHDFTFVLHWVPSHMKHGFGIKGNQIADQLADQASGARTAATHGEFSYSNHCEILREVMALVGGIERLFPMLDAPSARRAVARRAKPIRRRKRRLCDVP